MILHHFVTILLILCILIIYLYIYIISVSYMCVIILLPPQTAESVSGYMNGYGIIQLVAASRFTPAVSACVCQHFNLISML